MKKYRSSIFGGIPRRPRQSASHTGNAAHKQPKPKRRQSADRSASRPKESFRTEGRRRQSAPRKKRGLAAILSLVMVFAGVGLLGYSMLGAGEAVAGMVRATIGGAEAPGTTDMKLTVPEMSRVKDSPVYTAAASDTPALDQGAVHVEGTGFPWDAEANVYIAGHRLGYPGTGSFLQFRDLDRLENGDEMIIEDANGATYTYTVFEKMTVAPDNYQVTAPVPGKNIISLQTCTLPDYSERLIVQGELTSIT